MWDPDTFARLFTFKKDQEQQPHYQHGFALTSFNSSVMVSVPCFYCESIFL